MIFVNHNRLENFFGKSFFGQVSVALRDFLAQTRAKGRNERLRKAFENAFVDSDPLFHQIQIETCSFCNNDCNFCPASNKVDPRGANYMPDEIFERLLEDLAGIQFNGLISLFNNNEPLIDKRLPNLVRRIKQVVGNARIEIYTNGILLNMERACALWDAGLDSLVVDYYYNHRRENRRIENFLEQYKASTYSDRFDITVSYIDKNIIRSNRGGFAPNKSGWVNRHNPLGFCAYPFMQANINYRGDMHICCADYKYDEIMGNINQKSISEIWNSKRYREIRKSMLENNRNFGICSKCDVQPMFYLHNGAASKLVKQKKNDQLIIPEYGSNRMTFDVKGEVEEYRF